MQMSEKIGTLAAALAEAQGQMRLAEKNAENPFYKSRYADLGSIWAAARGPLSAHGLAIIQTAKTDGAKVAVTTILAHASGEWVSDELTMEGKDDSPQSIGTVISYARRYALAAVAGIAAEGEDDDAQSAQPAAPRPKPAATKPVHTRQQWIWERAKRAPLRMDAEHFQAWVIDVCGWDSYHPPTDWTPAEMTALETRLATEEAKEKAL
jgi:hypothetical protein